MVARKRPQVRESKPRAALTPEGQETYMISRAMQLAEQQLADGTAPAQVITHFLKLGTTRERLEQERLARENELLKAKAAAMLNAEEVKVLYEEALKAMRTYSGQESAEYDDR